MSELLNNRENCKYRGLAFASGPKVVGPDVTYAETSASLMSRVGGYVSPKLEIGEVEGKGRCVTAVERINKGETLMVC